jgi:hypothetical protein
VRYVSVGDEVSEHVLTVPVAVNLVSSDEAAAAAPDLEVTEEVHLLRAARARDAAVQLADAGDFEAAQSVAMQADAELRSAGLDAEADALAAERLLPHNYSPQARKQLRYESNLRRRRRN